MIPPLAGLYYCQRVLSHSGQRPLILDIALGTPWSRWPGAAIISCVAFISPSFIISSGILPIKKVRCASVFIIALIIFREESELPQDVCYKMILSSCS